MVDQNNWATKIINLSGGIDSAYLLWKELSQNQNEKILIHHCSIINSEGRHLVELRASRNIVDWLRKNINDDFFYIETAFDYKEIGYIIRDIEVIAFMNAAILRSGRHQIKEILVSANAHDESNNPNEESVVRRRQILDSIGGSGNKNSEKLKFPMIHLTKKQIIDEIPKDLLDLTWYCRRPVAFDSKKNKVLSISENANFWYPCNSCKTCNQVNSACSELSLKINDFNASKKAAEHDK